MKLYTDLEQSKKLTKILSEESADHFHFISHIHTDGPLYEMIRPISEVDDISKYWPCWSLAALLDILESEIDGEEGETYQLNINKECTWWDVWYRERYEEADSIEIASAEELIDACYNMILKLHELKML